MTNKSEFICVAPSKEVFNIYGESLGIEGERALYYSSDVGPHRIYRSSFPIEPYYFRGKDINRKMKLLKYETIQEAQSICDEINRVYGDNFEPKIIAKIDMKKA